MSSERPFAAFDIDGTLIRWQLFHATADALIRRGAMSAEQFEATKQARMAWKQRRQSFKDYERNLVTVYEGILSSLRVSDVEAAMQDVFNEYKDQVYTYSRDIIKELKAKGYVLFALSGSQIELVTMLAKYYGFDDWAGSTYEHAKGRFTGTSHLVLGRKDKVLADMVKKHGATYKGSIALGDSAGDIAMLAAVEQPIAFNPEQSLLDHAKAEGWKVVVERKNVVYELEPGHGTYVLATPNDD